MATAVAGAVTTIKSQSDWEAILGSASVDDKAVVVDFSATWCGPCRMISPYFDELSKIYTDVVFLKVDVDEVEAVAALAGISAMPTFQVYKAMEKAEELVGASKQKLKDLIEKYSSVKA